MEKQDYLEAIVNQVNKKINSITEALNDTQTSANSDTKSSAGDKHETSRAMAHLENERLAGQLKQLQLQLETINKINPEITSKKASFGSVISTDNETFFISTGLGKVTSADLTFFAIGSGSPVGKNLIGKEVGDEIRIGGKLNLITAIC